MKTLTNISSRILAEQKMIIQDSQNGNKERESGLEGFLELPALVNEDGEIFNL